MTAGLRLHYGYAEAAAALGVEESFLRNSIRRLPHRKPTPTSRYVLFSEQDLQDISAMWAVQPELDQTAAAAHVPAGLADLRPIGARRRRTA